MRAPADPPRILIAASGTGGHLFPALFIAKKIRALSPTAEVAFVGSGRPLEIEILGKSGFPLHRIRAVGVKRLGLRGFVDFMLKLPLTLLDVWKLLGAFSPDAVIGVGGYVSVFPVLLGRLRKIPSWIHEAEINPGLANRVLSLFASRVSVSFADAKIGCKTKMVFTGQPVRDELLSLAAQPKNNPPRNILVMGGSQGAQALDLAVRELAPLLRDRNLALWHQCRPENEAPLTAHYRNTGIEARVTKFIENSAEAFAWSDLIISRAGAGAVSELSVINIPCILVPYPFAQGNHQKHNADTLAAPGKALIVEEGNEFVARLRGALLELLEPGAWQKMRAAPGVSRPADAAKAIAAGALELIDGPRLGNC
ncbi:MAG: UDP-N-acetylglucosamine--N-acetylmuramyl-(pentapeptide) pyrophosphoryl-undecaprenol N-acetylglucosamine transferase [Oligoflexia bacterium]|nr:UDP-N-acetylglucosamine--N-acetylmuramyl-(pentapeptide) pyrophosphoryl-undecaprenol N-acetylglucosamine transferase [Oligoflexia bacterium]